MILFLYGPDDYRRRAKREGVIAEFIKKHGPAGLGRFDVEEGIDPIAAFLLNQSIFAPVRLLVLSNAFASEDKGLPSLLERYASDPSTTILLSESAKPPKPWSFLLAKSKGKAKPVILAQSFDLLKGTEWDAFIRSEAATRELSFTAPAFRLLSAAYSGDSWRLVTELDKLSLLGKRSLSESDLSDLALELEPDFWTFVNSFRSSRLGDRLAAMEGAFARNEPAAKLFHILAYQFKEKLPRFAAYDLAVKSGKLEYEEALVDSVLG